MAANSLRGGKNVYGPHCLQLLGCLCKLGESQSTVLDCRCHGCYVCSCQNDEEQLVWRAIGTCEASGAQSQPEVWVMISQYCLNSINFNDSIIFDSFQFLLLEIILAQWVGAFHQHPQTLQAALEKLHQLPAASAKTWTKTSEAYGEQFKDHNITALVEGKHPPFIDVGFLGLWDLGDGHLLVLRCQRKWVEIVG